jgi:rhodanese-related sulfurtransferase
MMQQGWALLDIRPPTETQKVGIVGAVTVPLYVEDPSNSFSSLLKKSATIGTGGWWLGGTHMIPNNDFLAQVRLRAAGMPLGSCPKPGVPYIFMFVFCCGGLASWWL